MKRFGINTSIAVILGLGIALALVWAWGGERAPVEAASRAEGHIKALSAPAEVLHVCPSGCAYSSIQDAVDAANDGDVIKVAAGTYTGVQDRTAPPSYIGPSTITQVVYISKNVTIRGGYTTDNWTTSDPENNPTTLDAERQGRVLFITGNISPTIEGLRITGGDASGLRGSCGVCYPIPSWTEDAGGGVYVNAMTTLKDNQVFSNTAEWGGGLYLGSSNATISDNIITNNTADDGSGGGLYLYHNDATISGNIVSNNPASSGGGLFLLSSDATISGNTVTSNTAEKWHGGGLLLYWGDATISGNAITNNTANISGGGLHMECPTDSGWEFCYENNTLIGNTISGNTAQGNGGGVCGGGTLIGNIVSDNTAQGNGGGVWGGGTFNGNIISSNTANTDGGGLYLDYSDATLINNAVTDNQANDHGSGLYIYRSSARLLHTNIARNTSGDGSGVYVAGEWYLYSTVALTNTILVSHTVGISVMARNTATLESTLWNDNTTNWSGGGTVEHSNDHAGNPVFVDPDHGDYHIGPGSAAIDAGVDAGVDHDIDGDPRPLGSGYDLGADEAGLFVTKHASPDPVQPGAALTYTIFVNNPFDIEVHATITDTLPEHITLGKTFAGTLILPGGVVTWTAVSIAPQGVWTDTVVVTVETDYAGPLVNVVEVTTDEDVSGRYVHILAPDLEVTKQAHASTVQPGEQLTYTITVTNTGNYMLHATITDTLPLSVTLVETSGGTLALPGGTVVMPDGRVAVIWTDVITAPGGLWMGTIVVTVDEGYVGPLINLVEVTTKESATGADSVTVFVSRRIHLPVVMRGFS